MTRPTENREPLVRETVEKTWAAWRAGATVAALISALDRMARAGNGAAAAAIERAGEFAAEPLTMARAGDIMLAARQWGAVRPSSPAAVGFGAERRAAR